MAFPNSTVTYAIVSTIYTVCILFGITVTTILSLTSLPLLRKPVAFNFINVTSRDIAYPIPITKTSSSDSLHSNEIEQLSSMVSFARASNELNDDDVMKLDGNETVNDHC